jgi:hypothetical protein
MNKINKSKNFENLNIRVKSNNKLLNSIKIYKYQFKINKSIRKKYKGIINHKKRIKNVINAQYI